MFQEPSPLRKDSVELEQLTKSLHLILQNLAETRPPTGEVLETLALVPDSKFIPVQLGLLSLCKEVSQADTVEHFLTPESSQQSDFISQVGSKAVVKLLEKMPMEEFLRSACSTIQKIREADLYSLAIRVNDFVQELQVAEVKMYNIIESRKNVISQNIMFTKRSGTSFVTANQQSKSNKYVYQRFLNLMVSSTASKR